MRRIISTLILLILVAAMAVSVSAANGATAFQSSTAVSADGSCHVSISMTLKIDSTEETINFPVPREASGLRVNGSMTVTSSAGDMKNINLSRVIGKMTGEFSVNIQYTLRNVVSRNKDGILQLQVPLLCGFSYPVNNLAVTVTLPGQVPVRPSFSSGYHQAAIEEDLECTVDGSVITVRSLKAMKDHETLTMIMAVSDDMFPQSIVAGQSADSAYIGIGIAGGLALLYWLITLRSLPWQRKRSTQPPQGYTAGQLGGVLYMEGVDLAMCVFTWAQLGYLLIERDCRGHVLLHKRMEMGNERNETERQCFSRLFGKKDTVDTRSHHYALLQQTVEKRPTMIRELLKKRTGNSKVYRFLASLMAGFAGAGIGLSLSSGGILQGFFVVLLGVLGGFGGWYLVPWMLGVCLRRRKKLYQAAAVSVGFLLLGLLAGEFMLALWLLVIMLPTGVLYAWSGQRTSLGRQTVAQVIGLRGYLRRPGKDNLQQLLESDPDYFFQMLPCAMALGADMEFARSFGKTVLEGCPFAVGVSKKPMRATGWCIALRKVAAEMDRRADNLSVEKLLGKIRKIVKK